MTFQDFFSQAIAYNPTTGALVTDADFTVHAVDDASLSTSLAVTDPASGVAITSLRSSSVGVLPDMRVAGDPAQVIIKSGSFVTKVTSVFGAVVQAGLDPATVAASIAAGATAANASAAAVIARDQAVSASSAATSAASAVEGVVATNDGIMAANVGTGGAFDTKLNATIGDVVGDSGLTSVRVGGVAVSEFDVEDTPVTKVDVGLENVDNTADVDKLMSAHMRAVLGFRNVTGETMPRWAATNVSGVSLQNGTVRVVYFTALKTETVTQMGCSTGTTAAGATPTLIKFGLYSVASNGNLTRLARTASDTTMLATVSQAYAKSFTDGTAELIAGQRYALAYLLLSSVTAPTLVGVLGLNSTEIAQSPRLAATVTGQTDLESSYAAGSLVSSGAIVYGWVAP